jgi:hypothetical protein
MLRNRTHSKTLELGHSHTYTHEYSRTHIQAITRISQLLGRKACTEDQANNYALEEEEMASSTVPPWPPWHTEGKTGRQRPH